MSMNTVNTAEECQKIQQAMQEALDGLLAPDEQARMQAHLRGCPACRAQWQALQRVHNLLSSAPVLSPPVGFAARVEARIVRRQAQRGTLPGLVGLMAGALVLIVWGFLSLLSLLEPFGLGWQLYHQPEAVTAFVQLLSRALDVIWAVLRGGWVLLNGLLTAPIAPLVLAYAVAVLGLALLWARIVGKGIEGAESTGFLSLL